MVVRPISCMALGFPVRRLRYGRQIWVDETMHPMRRKSLRDVHARIVEGYARDRASMVGVKLHLKWCMGRKAFIRNGYALVSAGTQRMERAKRENMCRNATQR